MNHFLMAALDFDTYRRELMNRLADDSAAAASSVKPDLARKTYPWDTPEVAVFKYFFNFALDPTVRDSAVKIAVRKIYRARAGIRRATVHQLG